ncbi:aminopeptidase P family protein [Fenollaria sporofastidiosus]|uniref:aminopeptidase P family protein n=1 Tax=Fenollaria sporofastidiosus TaxID=2811778 RepID=UPI001BFFE8DA|nr:aminopeptidase P family protein [Fenollaria sporofastidiosus]
MSIDDRVKSLRELMKKHGITMYIVATADPHMNEYISDHYKDRVFISGFTGSQGNVIITLDKAMLWVDGRYHVQAENQLKGTSYEIFKWGKPGVPTFMEYLRDNVKKGEVIGFNGKTFSEAMFETIEDLVEDRDVKFVDDQDLISEIWTDRPALKKDKAFILSSEEAGESTKDKLSRVRAKLKEEGADLSIIASLDDICWLYNIRANDIHSSPVLISYAYVDFDKAAIYTDLDKLDECAIKALNEQGVEVKDYDAFEEDLRKIKDKTIYLDENKMNRYMFKLIEDDNYVIDGLNITTKFKAVKNDTEIKNIKAAHITDGVALARFMKWLKEADKTTLDELTVQDKLHEFRAMSKDFIEESFDTICGYADNAAIVHYMSTKETNKKLDNKGLLLVDSGGQYRFGTTDVTRTMAMGPLTDEERKGFTLVLKGFIRLMSVVFKRGTKGMALDMLARLDLYKHQMDYLHGTGHGVGYLLNVHEGPHNISSRYNDIDLVRNMVFSVEPGVYEDGKYGVRTEVLIHVEDAGSSKYGDFFKLVPLTYAAIDKDAIDKDMLTAEEVAWLNSYHKAVYEKISPYLNEEEKAWLEKATSEI